MGLWIHLAKTTKLQSFKALEKLYTLLNKDCFLQIKNRIKTIVFKNLPTFDILQKTL